MNDSNLEETCQAINLLSRYLALRDLHELSKTALVNYFGKEQVDLLLIAGNCLPVTAEIAAKAYHEGLTRQILIAGGRGHTTHQLVDHLLEEDEEASIFNDLSEAEMFQIVLMERYQVPEEVILCEVHSRNGGENASESLKKVMELHQVPETMVVLQDPTMQRRLDASLKKYWSTDATIWANFAPFIPEVERVKDHFYFKRSIEMGRHWQMDHFLSLLLGEIPRLANTETGYGPKGKKFIVAVEIPSDVQEAHQFLVNCYPHLLRQMN